MALRGADELSQGRANRDAIKPAAVLEVIADGKGEGKVVFKETVSP